MLSSRSSEGERAQYAAYHDLTFEAQCCRTNRTQILAKGQLISKCLFVVFNSPKKQTKTIRLEIP